MNRYTRLVYSTDSGRVRGRESTRETLPVGDGIVRLQRQTKGRKGKGVTLISGLDLPETELKLLAKTLKQLCGTGGSVKGGHIEIQGEQREKLKLYLESQGYTVKIAGG